MVNKNLCLRLAKIQVRYEENYNKRSEYKARNLHRKKWKKDAMWNLLINQEKYLCKLEDDLRETLLINKPDPCHSMNCVNRCVLACDSVFAGRRKIGVCEHKVFETLDANKKEKLSDLTILEEKYWEVIDLVSKNRNELLKEKDNGGILDYLVEDDHGCFTCSMCNSLTDLEDLHEGFGYSLICMDCVNDIKQAELERS